MPIGGMDFVATVANQQYEKGYVVIHASTLEGGVISPEKSRIAEKVLRDFESQLKKSNPRYLIKGGDPRLSDSIRELWVKGPVEYKMQRRFGLYNKEVAVGQPPGQTMRDIMRIGEMLGTHYIGSSQTKEQAEAVEKPTFTETVTRAKQGREEASAFLRGALPAEFERKVPALAFDIVQIIEDNAPAYRAQGIASAPQGAQDRFRNEVENRILADLRMNDIVLEGAVREKFLRDAAEFALQKMSGPGVGAARNT